MPAQHCSALLGLLALSFAVLPPVQVLAESALTVPVGVMRYTFPATTQTTTTYISIPLTNAAVYAARVSAVGANTITFDGTPFTAGALAQAGSPFFARIASGAQLGRMVRVTANTTNVLTLDTTDNSSQTVALNTVGWSMAVGDRVEVIVGDTLSSFFGDGSVANPLKFVGGTLAGNSDTIGIYNKNTATTDAYFYSTTLGYWRKSNLAANANNLILFPESAIIVTRRSGRPAVSMSVIGDVNSYPMLTKIPGSNAVAYTSTRIPVDTSIGALSLNNWKRADIAGQADAISIYNAATARFDTYFQRLNGDWRLSGGGVTERSATSLPAGGMVLILRRDPLAGSQTYTFGNLPFSL